MTVVGSDYTSLWYSFDKNEEIVVANGEYFLLNITTRRVEKLGESTAEAKATLKLLGKNEKFPDFE